MKKNPFKKIISTLLISSFIIGIPATVSLADSNAPKAPTSTNAAKSPQGRNRGQFNIKPVLDKLVKAKTITAAQETKIIAFENKQNTARTAERQKLRTMTDAQRKAYMEKRVKSSQSNKNISQFADLVKNKTITQKQADAIDKAIKAARPAFGNRQNNGNNNSKK